MTEKVVTDQTADKILAMYKAGEKISKIEDKLGVSRSSIYWTLEKADVSPDRAKRKRRLRGDDHDLVNLYTIIESQEEEIARLTQLLADNGIDASASSTL